MLFSWQATGALDYNLHSAPDGAPPGYAESFDAQVNDRAHGSYTAPFTGIHGWYWENPTGDPGGDRVALGRLLQRRARGTRPGRTATMR